MSKADAATLLKDQISKLEEKRAAELVALKEEFFLTYESLKPVNIIRKSLRDILASQELQQDASEALLIVVSRFVSAKIEEATSAPPKTLLKQLLGAALQMAFTSLVAKYSEHLKGLVVNLLSLLSGKETDSKAKKDDGAEG
ncbi:hypothetical protein [Acetobacteroides hydrogenigenes]|uniref:Uncharacterized protein n=1 Tax=Acetobacteroides hydrogenigenes TaxID=979970 RepID=A0A4R2ENB2_9BACT|nr:hypothetical protein [Acetobacteroides hydrogenigenes]TCN70608.1 hypothetical protein CLV25_103128 [Acetobacteroides hydrogenigenes]